MLVTSRCVVNEKDIFKFQYMYSLSLGNVRVSESASCKSVSCKFASWKFATHIFWKKEFPVKDASDTYLSR